MKGRALMPRTASADRTVSLLDLVRELAHEGSQWVKAELALAQVETNLMVRRLVFGVIALVAGFATMIAALVVLAAVGIMALAPLLGSALISGLVVGLALLVLVVVLGLVTRQMFMSVALPGKSLRDWVSGVQHESSAK